MSEVDDFFDKKEDVNEVDDFFADQQFGPPTTIVYDEKFGPPAPPSVIRAEYQDIPDEEPIQELQPPAWGSTPEAMIGPTLGYDPRTRKEARAGARGAAQGATLNFSDELTGAGLGLWDFAKQYMANGGDKANLIESYRKHRNEARAANAQARDEAPIGYSVGEFVGSSVLPGSSLKALAGQGAAAGLGASEADLTDPSLENVLQAAGDTVSGGTIGAAIGSIPHLPGAAKGAGKWLTDAAEKRAVAATGATGVQALKYPEGTGRMLLDEGIVKFKSNPEEISEAAIALKERSGQEIGRIVEELNLHSENSFKLPDLLKAIDDRIKVLERIPANKDLVRQLNKEKKILQNHPYSPDEDFAWTTHEGGWDTPTGDPRLPYTKIHESKGVHDSKINYNSSDYQNQPNYIMRDIYNEAEERIAKSPANNVDSDLGKQFLRNKDTYHKIAPVAEAAEKRASTLNQSPPLGLLDMATVASAAPGLGGATTQLMQGDLLGGAAGLAAAGAGIAARRYVAPRFNSMRAVGSDKIGKALQKPSELYNKAQPLITQILGIQPELLGKYAKPLMEASQRGGTALASTHYVLYNRDPEYRQTINQLQDPNQINAENIREE